MKFEWDEAKRQQLLAERRVDIIDALEIFETPIVLELDQRRDYGEARFKAIGRVGEEFFVVVFTPRGHMVRVVTVWRAGRRERRRYQERNTR